MAESDSKRVPVEQWIVYPPSDWMDWMDLPEPRYYDDLTDEQKVEFDRRYKEKLDRAEAAGAEVDHLR